ncbi:MAG: hypothetical protein RIC87_19755 [Kiloniellales bacterium]
MTEALSRLERLLGSKERLAVAVSGGVDSLTLAWVAGRLPGLSLLAVHAVSPAVPPEATRRVQAHADRAGWDLRLLDAGEYRDPDYRSNPVDRCFFCKKNLYRRIGEVTDATIASGTNLDDLGDYRPGLIAAQSADVWHPYVEAGIDKRSLRAIAAGLGLADIASLPAQPCLASRVETGIPIQAADLAFVNAVESAVTALVGAGDIRCRIRREGVGLELPESLSRGHEERLDRMLADLCAAEGRRYLGRQSYRRGSAFLQEADGQTAA